jgi:HEAT repeat protein
MSHQPKAARREFERMGAPAFPHILRAIRDDNGLGPIKKAFLVDVIGKSRTKEAPSALTELLSYSDPFVRGLAVSHLGKRKYKQAIPYLVKLLDDKDVFVTNIKTDPERSEPVLVRDSAMEALQAITGRTMDAGATQDERARAWLRWWEKQQRPK